MEVEQEKAVWNEGQTQSNEREDVERRKMFLPHFLRQMHEDPCTRSFKHARPATPRDQRLPIDAVSQTDRKHVIQSRRVSRFTIYSSILMSMVTISRPKASPQLPSPDSPGSCKHSQSPSHRAPSSYPRAPRLVARSIPDSRAPVAALS